MRKIIRYNTAMQRTDFQKVAKKGVSNMQAIEKLKPGYSVKVSESNGLTVMAERSGDGKTLRYVRIEKNGSYRIIKTCSF